MTCDVFPVLGIFLDASVAQMVLAAAKRRARESKEEIIALTPHLSKWPHLHDGPLAYALYLGIGYTRPSRKDSVTGLTGFRYWLGGDGGYRSLSGEDEALRALMGELPAPTLGGEWQSQARETFARLEANS